ncbi:hypothetical protein CHUAL_002730 [Chamberlinius hualienensis]
MDEKSNNSSKVNPETDPENGIIVSTPTRNGVPSPVAVLEDLCLMYDSLSNGLDGTLSRSSSPRIPLLFDDVGDCDLTTLTNNSNSIKKKLNKRSAFSSNFDGQKRGICFRKTRSCSKSVLSSSEGDLPSDFNYNLDDTSFPVNSKTLRSCKITENSSGTPMKYSKRKRTNEVQTFSTKKRKLSVDNSIIDVSPCFKNRLLSPRNTESIEKVKEVPGIKVLSSSSEGTFVSKQSKEQSNVGFLFRNLKDLRVHVNDLQNKSSDEILKDGRRTRSSRKFQEEKLEPMEKRLKTVSKRKLTFNSPVKVCSKSSKVRDSDGKEIRMFVRKVLNSKVRDSDGTFVKKLESSVGDGKVCSKSSKVRDSDGTFVKKLESSVGDGKVCSKSSKVRDSDGTFVKKLESSVGDGKVCSKSSKNFYVLKSSKSSKVRDSDGTFVKKLESSVGDGKVCSKSSKVRDSDGTFVKKLESSVGDGKVCSKSSKVRDSDGTFVNKLESSVGDGKVCSKSSKVRDSDGTFMKKTHSKLLDSSVGDGNVCSKGPKVLDSVGICMKKTDSKLLNSFIVGEDRTAECLTTPQRFTRLASKEIGLTLDTFTEISTIPSKVPLPEIVQLTKRYGTLPSNDSKNSNSKRNSIGFKTRTYRKQRFTRSKSSSLVKNSLVLLRRLRLRSSSNHKVKRNS